MLGQVDNGAVVIRYRESPPVDGQYPVNIASTAGYPTVCDCTTSAWLFSVLTSQ